MLTGQHNVASIKKLGDSLGLINRNGNPYSDGSYHLMLANEFYYGYFAWNDENKQKRRIKGKHKPMVTQQEFKRVQILLGNNSNMNRMCSYDFPYRGPISCGECGRNVTAEQKLQVICKKCKHKFSIKSKSACPLCRVEISEMDNPVIIDKTYYHCTKRQVKCSQKGLESKEIEKQIRNVLESITVPEDFYEWAVEAFKYIHKDETSEQKEILKQVRKRETELMKRMDNLVCMRADGEINAEELVKSKLSCEQQLDETRDESEKLHIRGTDWLDTANQHLFFAKNLTSIFDNGTDNDKKEILLKFGSNLTMINQKLCIIVPKSLLGIRETYELIKDKKEWFEPKKALVKQGLSKGNRVPISVGLPR